MSNPTASQKRWLEYVSEMPCVATGFQVTQTHHIWGRETKVKGVGNIGHWAILPIWYCLHDVAYSKDNKYSVTHAKNTFEAKYGTQAELWLNMYELAVLDDSFDNEDLPSYAVVAAIENYRK